jgi:DNA processing protein
MSKSAVEIATILAALEVTPAEPRDISDILRERGAELYAPANPDPNPSSALLSYLRAATDPARVEYWERRVHAITLNDPDITPILLSDPEYPVNLRNVYDAPPLVWIQGQLLKQDEKALAVVGSRKASHTALQFASTTAQLAADAGITIVSGLAAGVDTQAHSAALDAGGRTIAVLGAAIDAPIFPRANQGLAAKIRTQGALLSQFRPGSPPTRSSFVLRNSVISGLSRASIIVEGTARSGTRSEAEYALKQGRKVLIWQQLIDTQNWAKEFSTQHNVRIVQTPRDAIETITEGPDDLFAPI